MLAPCWSMVLVASRDPVPAMLDNVSTVMPSSELDVLMYESLAANAVRRS